MAKSQSARKRNSKIQLVMKELLDKNLRMIKANYEQSEETKAMYALLKRIRENKPVNTALAYDIITQYVLATEKLMQLSMKLAAITQVNHEALRRWGIIARADMAIENAEQAHKETEDARQGN